ncbi:hypothetical protein CEV34_2133 [Brucella pseudogrignonensis]|uniref:Uncharacterized protein n=1 Tax=Brucella pseudogrignonensis TaxID=419475 RepID=A0A256GJZ9_9HYPH|nr:hypothetical protein CEV34_2133 [Brucella pseudogrignonensis]
MTSCSKPPFGKKSGRFVASAFCVYTQAPGEKVEAGFSHNRRIETVSGRAH